MSLSASSSGLLLRAVDRRHSSTCTVSVPDDTPAVPLASPPTQVLARWIQGDGSGILDSRRCPYPVCQVTAPHLSSESL